MKKYFLILGTLVIFFTTTHIASATSGACSDHGGVNCSAGAGDSGQVICNDGWDSSSVSYDSMEECNQQSYEPEEQPSTTITCVPPGASSFTNESNCAVLRAQEFQGGSIPSPSSEDLVNYCENQVALYQASELTYQTCLNTQNEARATAENELIQNEKNEAQQIQEANKIQDQQLEQTTEALGQQQCINLHGPNSIFSNGSCVCQSEYQFNAGQCVLVTEPVATPTSTDNFWGSALTQNSTDTKSNSPTLVKSSLSSDSFWGNSLNVPKTSTASSKSILLNSTSTASTSLSSTATTTISLPRKASLLDHIYQLFASFIKLF